MIKVDLEGAKGFWGEKGPDWEKCAEAHRLLAEGAGPGNDFLGWRELPRRVRETELDRILAAAARIRACSDALVVIGIGGSYLGARAAYDLLGRKWDGVELLFGQRPERALPAGHHRGAGGP